MRQRKILLLENVATQAAEVREHLTQAGFQVTVSRYEADGLKRLTEWMPEIVLVSTAHPAGDIVEYCRRVRALAPAVRIIMTSSLDQNRLYREHPGLQTVVDGVLLRPYRPEEVAAILDTLPAAPLSSEADTAADTVGTELRAEFQRQLDARFLEIEELKRHLDVATKRAASAPGLEWLQSENDHLRQGVEEARKTAALSLATEQLKRNELEVKFDNLLRLKEDFEFRAQNDLEERTRQIDLMRGQVQELRERADAAEGERTALRLEVERTLVEKERIEERLHALESDRAIEAALPEETPRIAALESELSRQRAITAGGEVELADLAAKTAVLEASTAEARAALADAGERRAALENELAELRRERAADERREQECRSAASAREREQLERCAGAERRVELLQSVCDGLEQRLNASEQARAAAVTETESRVERRDAECAELRARLEELGRELTLSRDRVRELAAECERLTGLLAERERVLAAEIRGWRDRAEAAELEIQLLKAQGAERASREEAGRLAIAEHQERVARERAELEARVVNVSEELSSAGETHRREVKVLEERVHEAETAARETRLQLEAQRASSRGLEEELAAREASETGAGRLHAELQRIQELLEEVISRARTEAVDYARRDAELSARLEAAVDERRLLQERYDRASAEAAERERRSSTLLQSAIDHGAQPLAERANLPAIVPIDANPVIKRRKPVLVGLAVAALAVLLAVFGLRRPTPPAIRERQPSAPLPQTGASPGAAATPREVWDRWTRSDGSGGVLVQATLRSERELRAEVDADRARGMNDEEARAELARRLRAFRFDTTQYVSVYLKNFAPGYPAYLDDLPGRFRLRDGSGNEVSAFLPPGHEKERRTYSFGAGAPGELFYEATVSLGFDRAGLSPSTDYLQLVVSDVGAASRRVLTWELE